MTQLHWVMVHAEGRCLGVLYCTMPAYKVCHLSVPATRSSTLSNPGGLSQEPGYLSTLVVATMPTCEPGMAACSSWLISVTKAV